MHLTNIPDKRSDAAYREAAGAPDEEIGITPAMIEAGEGALASVNFDFESHDDAAIRIYRAMERARSKGHSPVYETGAVRFWQPSSSAT